VSSRGRWCEYPLGATGFSAPVATGPTGSYAAKQVDRSNGLNSGGVPVCCGQLTTGVSKSKVVGTPASAPLSEARASSPKTKSPRGGTVIAGMVGGAKGNDWRIGSTHRVDGAVPLALRLARSLLRSCLCYRRPCFVEQSNFHFGCLNCHA
jgi:hypothetical protein